MKQWNVYLSGEIHTDWREQIMNGAKALDLNIAFSSANTDHASSDAAGDVLGKPESNFWRDQQSSRVNSIRIKTLIQNCDIAVIRFGDKLGKPYITLHDENIVHPLKEVDGAAMGWAKTPEQVIEVLRYTISN